MTRPRLVALLAVLAAALAVSAPSAGAAPSVTSSCTPAPADCGAWHAAAARIQWTTTDVQTRSCDSIVFSTQGEHAAQCTYSTDGSTWQIVQTVVRIDLTPPTVTGATPDRVPDHDGWYVRPVSFAIAGTDDLSGLAACDPVTYAGPTGAPAIVAGACRDNAGNVAARGFPLSYDDQAPAAPVATAVPGDRSVRVRWIAPADAVRVTVTRSPGRRRAAAGVVYRGAGTAYRDRAVANGRRYEYAVQVVDAAGNTSRTVVAARPGRRLLAPARGARVAAPPLLRWTPVRGATYYNVQLFHGRRKVLSAWPTRAALQLRARWTFAGRRHRLVDGRYRWVVWPGRGRRAAQRYGGEVGRRVFSVRHGAARLG